METNYEKLKKEHLKIHESDMKKEKELMDNYLQKINKLETETNIDCNEVNKTINDFTEKIKELKKGISKNQNEQNELIKIERKMKKKEFNQKMMQKNDERHLLFINIDNLDQILSLYEEVQKDKHC